MTFRASKGKQGTTAPLVAWIRAHSTAQPSDAAIADVGVCPEYQPACVVHHGLSLGLCTPGLRPRQLGYHQHNVPALAEGDVLRWRVALLQHHPHHTHTGTHARGVKVEARDKSKHQRDLPSVGEAASGGAG